MEFRKQLVCLSCLFFSLLFLNTYESEAQEDIFGIERKIKSRKSDSEVGNAFRNAVSNFSFEISSGAGFHQHQLDFMSEVPENYPITELSTLEAPVFSDSDTTIFKSTGFAYPVNLGVRLNLFDLINIGAGYGREWGSLDKLTGDGNTFALVEEKYTYDKFYGTVGLVLWDAGKRSSFLRWKYRKYSDSNLSMQAQLRQRARQYYPWRITLEGEFGSITLKKSLDPQLSVVKGYYGLGLRIERDLSEYSKFFIKPAAEFRPYDYNMIDPMEIQGVKQALYTLQVGVAISLPGSKRCKISGCRVVMRHLHNGVEYRGSSIFKRQNRKVGEWYGN
ncbi:hypothetical protein [uncultured Cyclobacterium sp.]|uniref:hypothetical protein n=1 Tax=uncultured Cyclobacterium sp. TaxID=453820 RepID=UPI0030ED0D92